MAANMLFVCLALALVSQMGALSINPVTRVVQLMEGLTKKIEADGRAEEDLFESYVCWYKTVTSTKKASNAEATDRISALTSYVDDVKSGRMEFTTERKDLQEEIKKLSEEVGVQKGLRTHEAADFEAAKDEMQHAIASLEKAIEVLSDPATSGAALTSVGFDLRRVIDIGKSSLSKKDSQLLQQALDSNHNFAAPKIGKQGSRSDKIKEILEDMKQTFEDNLGDATQKEADAKANYGKLMLQKESQLTETQEAFAAGTAEADARALQVAETQEEIDMLLAQVKIDEGYIKEAEKAHAAMSQEWTVRKQLRAQEIEAIGKAIAVLTSDEARDTLSASFDSQKALFLQVQGSATCLSVRAKKASQVIRQVAVKHNSTRLAMLAVDVRFRTKKGSTDAVVKGIEKIMSDLHKESDADLKVKEDCEDDRNRNTKMAKNAAYEIDTETSLIVRKEAEIDAKQKEIKRLSDESAELDLQRQEAEVARTKEGLEYKHNKADDEAALTLIAKATGVLEVFYAKLGETSLAQVAHQQPVVAAGEAPPPPPMTWSEPYGGAKGESVGITAILGMISEDIEKDIKAADVAEQEAIETFDAFMSTSAAEIASIETDVTALEGEIGDAEEIIKEARSARADEKKVMDSALIFLRSIAEGCDYMAANFEYRKQVREEEVDGLIEAEAMLSGGEKGAFSKAFLQDAEAGANC